MTQPNQGSSLLKMLKEGVYEEYKTLPTEFAVNKKTSIPPEFANDLKMMEQETSRQ